MQRCNTEKTDMDKQYMQKELVAEILYAFTKRLNGDLYAASYQPKNQNMYVLECGQPNCITRPKGLDVQVYTHMHKTPPSRGKIQYIYI